MITGVTRGAGGSALGKHLANEANNEEVVTLEGRGLIATSILDQVKEITRMSSHARTHTPIYHVHVDPPADHPWTEEERESYWERFEAEFGFESRPYAAVEHIKAGRRHEHRVYLRVRPDGTAIDVSHDFARIERLNREFEFERGDRITLGSHSRSVLRRLEADGKLDVAAAMRVAGAATLPRPRALVSPKERAQQERTGVLLKEMISTVLTAWRASDSGESFRAALAVEGICLFEGEKVPVVLDGSGAAHPLARLLAKAAKSLGAEPIRAADVKARLFDLKLPEFKPGDYKHNFLAQAEFLEAMKESVSASTPTLIEVTASQEIEGDGSHNEISEVSATSTIPKFENPFSELEQIAATRISNSQEIWNEYKRNIEARAEALDLGRRKKHPGWEGSGREKALHLGSEWIEPSELRSIEGSRNGKLTNPPARTSRTTIGGGDQQDRPYALAVGADCRGAGGSPQAHARSRIQNFRIRRALAWQANCQHRTRAPKEVAVSIRHFGIAVLAGTETDRDRENSRLRWLAAALRRAYDLDWVPNSVVNNIAHIRVDRKRNAVVLELHSGTCLLDRHTRIDVVGAADDIAVQELAAAAQRKGWTAVRLFGDDEFKRAATIELAKLNPPIIVRNSPLAEEAESLNDENTFSAKYY